MQANNDLRGAYVRYFADGAADSAARSLQFLRVIESTVEALNTDADRYDAIAEVGHELADLLRNKPLDRSVDDGGEIEAALENGMGVLRTIMEKLQRGRAAARSDSALRREDGVVEAYDRLIDSLHNCHQSLCDVLWALTEHDIDHSTPSAAVYKSVDDLFAALKTG